MNACLAAFALTFFPLSQPALGSPNGSDGSNGAEGTAALGVDWAPKGEEALNPYRQSIQRVDPMDTTGLDDGLANVLRNYYRKNFTGESTWAQVESIRFEGTLHLPRGSVRFVAFKKKPDLCKVVLEAPRGRIVMAYDGQDAWQLNTIPDPASRTPDPASRIPEPAPMPAAEAANFIRDATTGGHLLYPLARGKRIELLGAASFDGERCYQVKVTLPDGQVIRSFLDMTDYAERRQITVSNVNGDEEVNTHGDFRRIGGVRVPFTSTLTIGGRQIHQSRISKVETNLGAMPWMFSRPTADSTPDEPHPAPDSHEEPPVSFEASDTSFTTDSIWNLPP